jgi:hypothetical protein
MKDIFTNKRTTQGNIYYLDSSKPVISEIMQTIALLQKYILLSLYNYKILRK